MQVFDGRLIELRLSEGMHGAMARIACPTSAIPAPGRYVLTWRPDEGEAPLAVPLFATQIEEDGFLATPAVPSSWMPGARLSLRRSPGRGFRLPATVRRLALADLGGGADHLLPLISLALAQEADVAFYSDSLDLILPLAVEVNPLSLLPQAHAWADFLALDLSMEHLADLPALLGFRPGDPELTIPAQALIVTPMPCGGIAECGACSIRLGRNWKLACKDGPVFDLNLLLRNF